MSIKKNASLDNIVWPRLNSPFASYGCIPLVVESHGLCGCYIIWTMWYDYQQTYSLQELLKHCTNVGLVFFCQKKYNSV